MKDYVSGIHIDLPPPRILGVEEGVLSPVQRPGAWVVVDYPGIVNEDEIRVFWNGQPTRGEEFYRGGPDSPVFAAVPARLMAPDLNSQVVVHYEVLHTNGEQDSSPSTEFFLREFLTAELPTPVILQVVDGTLDTRYIVENATVALHRWPLVSAGQTVWISLRGLSLAGEALEVALWEGHVIEQDEPDEIVFDVFPKSTFQMFANESVLTLISKVNFSGGPLESEATAFPVLECNLVNPPLNITYQAFDGQPDQLIESGQRLDLPGMKLDVVQGKEKCGVKSGLLIPAVREGPALIVCDEGDGTFNSLTTAHLIFDKDFISVEFFYSRDTDGVQITVAFENAQGESVGISYLAGLQGRFYFSPAPYRTFKKMIITALGPVYLDFFTLSN